MFQSTPTLATSLWKPKFQPEMEYGENTMCVGGSITAPDGTLLVSPLKTAISYGLDLRLEIGNPDYLEVKTRFTYGWAGHWYDTYDDATLGVTINKEVDGQTTLIHQEDVPFSGASEVDYDYFFTPSGNGDYCVEFCSTPRRFNQSFRLI